MAAELDEGLEAATREAFARMFGAIRAPVPDLLPDATRVVPAVGRADEGRRGQDRLAGRGRLLVVAAAGVAAAAAIAVSALVLPSGADGDRISTDTPPAAEDGPSGSTTSTPEDPPRSTTSTTTDPTTSTTATTATTLTTGAGQAVPPLGVPQDGFVPSGQVRPAERRLPLAEQAGLDVPLERLAGVAQVQAASGPVVLRAADDGEEIALDIGADWLVGFGSGIEGTPRQLQTHWMVSAVDNQFVVWGLVPSEIRRVTVYTTSGGVESAPTVDVGPPALGSAAFAVILPQLAYIDGLAGELADGTVSLAGTELEPSLRGFRQHSPHLREWTGFIPVVRH